MLRPLLLNRAKKYQIAREEEVLFPELAKQVSLCLGERGRMRSFLVVGLCFVGGYLEQQGDYQLAIALSNPVFCQDFRGRERASI